MRLKELMKRKVVTVRAGDTVRTARFLMQQQGVRHLPVVEGGHVVGVVSERDLHAPSLPGWSDWEQATLDGADIGSIMSAPPTTLSPDDSAQNAANIMRGRKLGCVPVVNRNDRLVGIVTRTDILEAFSRTASTARGRTAVRTRANKRVAH